MVNRLTRNLDRRAADKARDMERRNRRAEKAAARDIFGGLA